MHAIDWLLLIVPLLLVLSFALYTRRFVRSVADFLAGGRCAGRYLIANAFGESAAGVANTMSKFEMIMVCGFTLTFWNSLSAPVLLLVAVSGFVIYRYRETRALTLAQFFEMRYSRRFRLFMGMLAFTAGILNYGIFPAVSSRFFVYFLGLPQSVSIAGVALPTFAIIMAAYLSCVIVLLTTGGQITLMVSDCAEGLISHLILIVIVIAVFLTVGWSHVVSALSHAPPGLSRFDPFDAFKTADFNVSYVVMTLILAIYGTMALQNTQGFNAAARTPHESRMAGLLGRWRLDVRIMLLLGVTTAAATFLTHPDFAAAAQPANRAIAAIGDSQLQKQQSITLALRYMLPAGIKGLFCSMMIMGLIAGDCSHVHSWGSIFIQDVILPLRRRPLGTAEHLKLLRLALIGVAAFGFFFSLLFTQTHFIALWWQITNAIFISGAGAAIIGGLYWRRGTTAAAWSAVVVGAILAGAGILLHQYRADQFPLNGVQVAFIAMIASSLVYAIVSLFGPRGSVNLDRLLHRGVYALTPPAAATEATKPLARASFLRRLLGFDERFTRGDKLIAILVIGWSLLLLLINTAVAVWNAFFRWPIGWWSRYWLVFGIGVPLAVGLATLVWFAIGGVRDLRDFFIALRTLKRDPTDDGHVAIRAEVTSTDQCKSAEGSGTDAGVL